LITQYLSPDTHIVWGPKASMVPLITAIKDIKMIKLTPLGARGPLFSSMAMELESAFDQLLTECLGELTLKPPKIITHSGADAEYIVSPTNVRDVLVKQYSKPINLTNTVKVMIERGFRTWVEVGPGSLYGGFIRKIDNNNRIANVENMKSLSIAVRITE